MLYFSDAFRRPDLAGHDCMPKSPDMSYSCIVNDLKNKLKKPKFCNYILISFLKFSKFREHKKFQIFYNVNLINII